VTVLKAFWYLSCSIRSCPNYLVYCYKYSFLTSRTKTTIRAKSK